MLKLFRNIRKKQLADSRFGKYLLYAIGEIILVVIGILIALSINNWNENRKSNAELQLIHQNLIQEFEANRDALQEVLGAIAYTKNGSLENLALIGSNEPMPSEAELNKMIEKSLFFPTWKPSNFTLNELKNTGKLSLLKNNTLKELLFKWETQIEIIEEWNRRVEKSSQDIVDYLKINGSLRNLNHKRIGTDTSKLEISNISLFNDKIFENLLDEKALYSQFMEHNFQDANVMIEEILKETNKQ
ncbi:DUF6090 family protein [Marixanthomonas spongiae]|uniref:Uncharacterized protein n=1 Tax=Marixanthomonas spongiae TaxID=2174845 RepID=A0A2U0I5U7_9FLAO|nr:DUF6090 family protein [Marixanthomonas spongiae]PVW16491.1 hypothetical protein DDV96_04365 [Marixanthomonas spongiae]